MKHILGRTNLPLLRRFARSNVLLAFDFDGTLAPIVRDPDRARMRVTTSTLLRRLAAIYPCAVISGRSKEDVARRLGPIPLFAIVGEHGADEDAYARYVKRVADWAHWLRRGLWTTQGVEVEQKVASIAIHYRGATSPGAARRTIAQCITSLAGKPRIVGGKCVVNVLPTDAPHKGNALEVLRNRARATTAIFVGDDLTDEDVFSMDTPDKLLSIRVGRSQTSAAPYCLHTQREIDALLDLLVRFGQEHVAERASLEASHSQKKHRRAAAR